MDFFTSDHHFGHSNIIGYCKRPFSSVTEMDRVMYERWNAVVRPVDRVYYLGDFALHYDQAQLTILLSMLHGTKILICGNHDDRLQSQKKWLESGFSEVYTQRSIAVGPYEKVLLTHFPRNYALEGQSHWRIHGHVHTSFVMKGRSLNVGVDVHNFTPLSTDEVVAHFRTAVAPRPKEYYATALAS